MSRILIVGGSSGIGAALVPELANDGHDIYVCARRLTELEAVTREDTIARAIRCDVTDYQQIEDLFDWIGRREAALDAIIITAAILGPIGPFEMLSSAAWIQALYTNVIGAFLVAKHGLPLLEKGVRSRLITFAGGGAFNPFPRYSAYAVSKAGIVRLTECLAEELSPRGIAVNAVAPGMVATSIHDETLRVGPARAGADYFERMRVLMQGTTINGMAVAVDCVRFLLSEAADGLTGKTISANFDPWRTATFRSRLVEISNSTLYTMRRVNLRDLPTDDPLRPVFDDPERS